MQQQLATPTQQSQLISLLADAAARILNIITTHNTIACCCWQLFAVSVIRSCLLHAAVAAHCSARSGGTTSELLATRKQLPYVVLAVRDNLLLAASAVHLAASIESRC